MAERVLSMHEVSGSIPEFSRARGDGSHLILHYSFFTGFLEVRPLQIVSWFISSDIGGGGRYLSTPVTSSPLTSSVASRKCAPPEVCHTRSAASVLGMPQSTRTSSSCSSSSPLSSSREGHRDEEWCWSDGGPARRTATAHAAAGEAAALGWSTPPRAGDRTDGPGPAPRRVRARRRCACFFFISPSADAVGLVGDGTRSAVGMEIPGTTLSLRSQFVLGICDRCTNRHNHLS